MRRFAMGGGRKKRLRHLNMRLPPALLKQLTASAKANRRSMTGEINIRLQRSIFRDDLMAMSISQTDVTAILQHPFCGA